MGVPHLWKRNNSDQHKKALTH